MNCTEQQRQQIRELARELRKIAAPHGPMHSLWDRIFDMEEFAKGGRTIVEMTAAQWISGAEELLTKKA